jgi:hypothetical protein
LLLFDAHVAESREALELWADSFAEVGEGDRFDVESVSARELRFGFLVFAILLDRDGSILGDDELRAILKGFEFAGDAPETGFEFFLRVESLAPELERDRAGGVTCRGVTEETALLRAALAHRGDEYHQPQFFAEGNFGDGDVAAQTISVFQPQISFFP